MQTIGLIGGMSWQSSAEYYRVLNELVREKLGGLHSARCLLYSVDFAEIEQLQTTGAWEEAGHLLAAAGQSLEDAGADFLLLCTNTMHKVADAIEAAVSIPLVHIADVAAEAVRGTGVTRVGLLGTAFTMEQSFYRDRLATHGLEVVVPSATDRMVSTGSSMKSSAWVSFARSRGRRTGRSSTAWWLPAPKEWCSDVPSSSCSSEQTTLRCLCSRRPASMQQRQSTWLWRAKPRVTWNWSKRRRRARWRPSCSPVTTRSSTPASPAALTSTVP